MMMQIEYKGDMWVLKAEADKRIAELEKVIKAIHSRAHYTVDEFTLIEFIDGIIPYHLYKDNPKCESSEGDADTPTWVNKYGKDFKMAEKLTYSQPEPSQSEGCADE